jgi:23S rRNA (guanosine2251-2'-O)-methyltransferase
MGIGQWCQDHFRPEYRPQSDTGSAFSTGTGAARATRCRASGAGRRHHSPRAEGALAKTASGALEIVPIVAVANLARTLPMLADAGFLVLGLDEHGSRTIDQIDTKQPLACVMGAEGKGLRRLTRETCTELVRLPTGEAGADTQNEFVTLNVATAAAITLFALTR